jgi:hypothetical protein
MTPPRTLPVHGWRGHRHVPARRYPRSVGDVRTTCGKADAALDQRLTDELARFNAAATPGVAAAEELTVRVEQDDELIAGVSGWTFG